MEQPLDELLQSLRRFAESDLSDLQSLEGYNELRPRLLQTITKIHQKLETAPELSQRLGWQEPAHTTAIKVALDLNLFKYLQDAESKGIITTQEIASASGQNPELIGRTLRLLASRGTVVEKGPDKWSPSAKSTAMLERSVNSGIDCWFSIFSKAFGNLPRFLRERRYEQLEGPESESNWAMMTASGKGLFPWLSEHPDAYDDFTNHMVGITQDRRGWTNIYPARELILNGADPTGPLVVDVGGSAGQDVIMFNDRYPQGPGRLIVQDLPACIEVAKKTEHDPAVEFQVHDFRTSQPVKGSRVYFLHSILHDWPDDVCIDILKHLREAMRPGYSKILVAEFVIGSEQADPFGTALDYTVMVTSGTKERTGAAWRTLFHKAGLKITGLWSVPITGESVIEVDLD